MQEQPRETSVAATTPAQPPAPPTVPGAIGKPPKPVRADARLRPPAWVRWWARIDLALTAFWLVWALEQSSNAGYNDFALLLLVLFGLYLAGAWCARAVALLAWVIRHKPAPVRTLRPAIALVLIPMAAVVWAAAEMTDYDTQLRLKWSERALIAEADAMRAGNAFSGPGRYGTYRVASASIDDDGSVWFVTRYGAIFDEFGFVHRQDTAPIEPDEGWIDAWPIVPHWHGFRRGEDF